MMNNLSVQKLESIKVGILAALSFTLIYLFFLIVNYRLNFGEIALDFSLIIKLAIAVITGLLFGITYRYIIRDDHNHHLKDGAVFAFALVRILALIEAHQVWTDFTWIISIAIESFCCFLGVRFLLDKGLNQGWLKPYI
jgi:hypothetical protein